MNNATHNFFNYYLTVPHFREDSLTNPILITAFAQFWPEGNLEPRKALSFQETKSPELQLL